jgi:hypothetical protein
MRGIVRVNSGDLNRPIGFHDGRGPVAPTPHLGGCLGALRFARLRTSYLLPESASRFERGLASAALVIATLTFGFLIAWVDRRPSNLATARTRGLPSQQSRIVLHLTAT